MSAKKASKKTAKKISVGMAGQQASSKTPKEASLKTSETLVREPMYRPVCIKEDKYLSRRCMPLAEAQEIANAHQTEFKHQVNWEACKTVFIS